MFIRTVIAALSLQHDADPVLDRALQLAQLHAARLVVVHVLEEYDLPDAQTFAALHQTREDMAREQLRRLLNGKDHPGLEVVITHGRAADRIEDIAANEQADILVIGPGHPGTIGEKLFGSTADRLTRSGALPVLVVRTPAQGVYSRVAVAVDFSLSSRQAVDFAAALTRDSLFEIIHIVDLPLPLEQALLKAGTSMSDIRLYRRSRVQAARARLRDLLVSRGHARLVPRILVAEGAPGDALLRLSHEKSYDLLVTGAHGRSIMTRALLGSVTRRILHRASGDVLVVPAK